MLMQQGSRIMEFAPINVSDNSPLRYDHNFKSRPVSACSGFSGDHRPCGLLLSLRESIHFVLGLSAKRFARAA